ncbi:hypothetical protein [Luteolibacter sp. AS25]|uniref:hypothetical protein n=1 Tax=Luteolibacter sp. AS25 TaxID=3135776 RepID=UPI00398A56D9
MKDGIRLGGPVKVEGDNGLEIFADSAFLDLNEKSVTFTDDVSIYQGNLLQRGEKAVYYYEERKLDASGMRASMDPFLLEAGKFTGVSDGEKTIFVGENAGVTTNDIEKPNYWLRSDKTMIYPGEKVTFENLKVYAGETPVFYLPYLSQPLNSQLGYHFIPGARSNWGPYLLNTYGIMLGGDANPITGEKENQWLLSQWRFDILTTRGLAAGLNLIDTRLEDSTEITGLSLYHLYDLDPEETRNGITRTNVDPNRYKIQLKDRRTFDFEKEAEWRLDTNITLLSDQYYLEDFEPTTYTTNPAPDNTIGIYRRDEDSLFSAFGRFRANDFYRTDQRSPEIAYDQARRSIFDSPILHEGQTSFSIINTQAASVVRRGVIEPLLTLPAGDPAIADLSAQLNRYELSLIQKIRSLPAGDSRIPSLRAQLLDSGYTRFHTNHTFSAPLTYGDWFTFTPRAGAAYTNYSSVEGPEESDSRVIFHTGAEAAVKLSRNYGGFRNSNLGFDGLLHVLQPYVNWSYVTADELSEEYPRADRLTFTTRPRSLDPSRYTALDEFNSWNILRFGTRNHLITRRDNQSHEWLFLDTYMDKYFNDPDEYDREWSNLYNDLRWQPLPWLGIDIETQFPLLGDGSGFSEFSTAARFMPHENVEISLAYRHLNDNPVLLDSDRMELSTYFRLNDEWGVGTSHIYEMDDNRLEEQQYTVHRDFGNWVAGAGLSMQDNRLEDEIGVVFSLTLKEFPSLSLPFSIDAQ